MSPATTLFELFAPAAAVGALVLAHLGLALLRALVAEHARGLVGVEVLGARDLGGGRDAFADLLVVLDDVLAVAAAVLAQVLAPLLLLRGLEFLGDVPAVGLGCRRRVDRRDRGRGRGRRLLRELRADLVNLLDVALEVRLGLELLLLVLLLDQLLPELLLLLELLVLVAELLDAGVRRLLLLLVLAVGGVGRPVAHTLLVEPAVVGEVLVGRGLLREVRVHSR